MDMTLFNVTIKVNIPGVGLYREHRFAKADISLADGAYYILDKSDPKGAVYVYPVEYALIEGYEKEY